MKASRSARIGRVERHVGAAGLEDAEQRHDHLRASAPGRRHQHLGPDAQPRAGGARAGWPARSSSRVGQPLLLEDAPRPRRACAPPAPRTAAWTQRSPRIVGRRARSTRPAAGAARPAVSSGRSAQAPVRVGDDAREQRLEVARHAARWWPRRTGRCCTPESPRRPSAASSHDRAIRSNLAVALSTVQSSSSVRPGSSSVAPRRVLRGRTSPGRAALRLRSRSGLQLLDQLLERQVLVRVGAQRHLAHPGEQLAKRAGCPRGRCAAPGC